MATEELQKRTGRPHLAQRYSFHGLDNEAKTKRLMNLEQRKQRAYAAKHYQTNKDVILTKNRAYRLKVKGDIYRLLGDKCSLCPFSNKIALQIDHVYGGGYKHRLRVGITSYYPEIRREILQGSKDYRLLCSNCNLVEGVRLGYIKSIWN